MLKSFNCPKCGAPVSYDKDVVGANLTARCSYCNSSLSVPDEMRGRPAQIITPINIDLRNTGASATKIILVIVLIPVIGVIIGAIAMGGFLVPLFSGIKSTVKTESPPRTVPVVAGKKEKVNAFATQILNFGSEGVGPGMFKDARSIAVDESGKIYVGEYSGGRVQVFDPTGKFLTQWTVDPKMPLRGMAADRSGIVYIVQSGMISRYEGATGKPLGQLAYAGGWGFDDISIAADGGLVAAWYKNRDDLVRFNREGAVLRTIRAAISSVTDDSELDTSVAVDGLGNIYALGSFNNAVFKFSPEGKFITRFGDAGDQPGQFRAPSAIAVDGKGRVYVSDFKGVQVFDGNGRYLDVFDPGGIASGMVFDDKNELFIAARKEVFKLALKD
ncbi:MAG TPA: NHL repeat-containing protein [Pyrinomonadaceae bacterium]|jgi:DNA-binding beta-propeller fold protein YncE|nr:NHL repeat-containing protein [Pyrinomonadaceae bacterium]